MRLLAYRLVSLLILMVWMAPSAGALSVGVHVLLNHHSAAHHASEPQESEHGHLHLDRSDSSSDSSSEADRHTHSLSDTVQALLHGHHHDLEAEPHHDHEALLDGSGFALRFSAAMPGLSQRLRSLEPVIAERSPCLPLVWQLPPTALFTAHCSLLL